MFRTIDYYIANKYTYSTTIFQYYTFFKLLHKLPCGFNFILFILIFKKLNLLFKIKQYDIYLLIFLFFNKSFGSIFFNKIVVGINPSMSKTPFFVNNYFKKTRLLQKTPTIQVTKKINTYVNLFKFTSLFKLFILQYNSKLNNLNFVTLNKLFVSKPKYNSSSIGKYISSQKIDSLEFQFLRKNKVYNKGRYSRCRQNYRTGVYMCMYLSVISIFGLYFSFYKFSFNFTYLWWFFIFFLGSFIFPKVVKYRLYKPSTVLIKFFDFFRWSSLIITYYFK